MGSHGGPLWVQACNRLLRIRDFSSSIDLVDSTARASLDSPIRGHLFRRSLDRFYIGGI